MALSRKTVAIVGAGPAGLIAAEILSRHDTLDIHIFEKKPSAARKFLIAGRGGLNLTHSEPIDDFIQKYEPHKDRFGAYLKRFSPQDMIAWALSLGVETFKGSSGRIFPKGLKATPLLRAWLSRLSRDNIHFHLKHSWIETKDDGTLIFSGPEDENVDFLADAVLFAMGGASYPHLGSDGAWVSPMSAQGISITPFAPSNCGFTVSWSDPFLSRFEGEPIKNIRLSFQNQEAYGDLVITKTGLEGGVLYALSRPLREALEGRADIVLSMDLKPEMALEMVAKNLSAPRGKNSASNFLRKKLRLSPVKIGLLREFTDAGQFQDLSQLAGIIKSLPVRLTGINAISRAISSAGGISFSSLDENLMIRDLPGRFVAGEMLDWEAPTGGYLLQGSFATGVIAAEGIAQYLGLSENPGMGTKP
ncbi:MAG: TIGR03862 family flavoprotein [Proteobacteria bacterium]|nr:TIGR03862 family flavoprotein [Pseudomonadota bacterium]